MNNMNLKRYIRSIKDYPKKGIIFRDVTTLIENPKSFNFTIQKMNKICKKFKFNKIAAIEARGFLFASVLAHLNKKPLVLIRKKGKLPHKTFSKSFQLEYGTDKIEVHKSSINKNDQFLLIDDLIATGGTINAAIDLITKAKANVVGSIFLIDLPDLGGSAKLEKRKVKNYSLVEYKGL
jgi:adenine phosphoribosyltransferase